MKQEETKMDNTKDDLKRVIKEEETKALKEKANEKELIGKRQEDDPTHRTPKKKRLVNTPTLFRPNLESRGVIHARNNTVRKLKKTDLTQGKYTDRNKANWAEIKSWFKKINKYNNENKAIEDTTQEETKIHIKGTNDNTPKCGGTPVPKGFLRTEVDESEDTFIVKMVIENKPNETCHLEFPYNPSKDSPALVANEMVIALSLDEVDIPRIQEAIQREVSKRNQPGTTNESAREENEDLKMDSNGYLMRHDMKEHIDAIVNFISTLSDQEEINIEDAEGMKELDKAFMLEIFKLSKRYRKKQQEFLTEE